MNILQKTNFTEEGRRTSEGEAKPRELDPDLSHIAKEHLSAIKGAFEAGKAGLDEGRKSKEGSPNPEREVLTNIDKVCKCDLNHFLLTKDFFFGVGSNTVKKISVVPLDFHVPTVIVQLKQFCFQEKYNKFKSKFENLDAEQEAEEEERRQQKLKEIEGAGVENLSKVSDKN